MCDVMQRILYGIEQWCIKRELSVNPNNTEMVLFKNTVVASSQIKYLVLILDAKIGWKQQVGANCKKALALLLLLLCFITP